MCSAKTISNAHQACIDLTEYKKITTLEDKVEWLQKYGKAVCNEYLYPYVERSHRITRSGDYDTMVREYWHNRKPKYSKYTWEEIRRMTNGYYYDKYIGFSINKEEEVIKIKLIDGFTDKDCCYSIPLFRSIASLLELEPDDETDFEFTLAGSTGDLVVFRINGKDYNFYDYTNYPEFVQTKNAL